MYLFVPLDGDSPWQHPDPPDESHFTRMSDDELQVFRLDTDSGRYEQCIVVEPAGFDINNEEAWQDIPLMRKE